MFDIVAKDNKMSDVDLAALNGDFKQALDRSAYTSFIQR